MLYGGIILLMAYVAQVRCRNGWSTSWMGSRKDCGVGWSPYGAHRTISGNEIPG